jgi:hypothetical protein
LASVRRVIFKGPSSFGDSFLEFRIFTCSAPRPWRILC